MDDGGALNPGFVMPDGKRMLTTTEAADLWNELTGMSIHVDTYRSWARRGRLAELGVEHSQAAERASLYTDYDSLLHFLAESARRNSERCQKLLSEREEELKEVNRGR